MENDNDVRKIIRRMAKTAGIEKKSEDYQFGFAYFGPFLYGYLQWLFKMIEKQKASRLFFFSRDGYMMDKAFRLLFPGYETDSEYVYVSRQSLRQALLWNCSTYEDSLKYLTIRRYLSFGALLEYYGFGEKERERLSKETGIGLEKEFAMESLRQNRQIKQIYEKLSSQILQKSREQDAFLQQYLKQIGFSGNCAITDIGWHGSMQYYLEEFVKRHNISADISGFYVGISPLEKLDGKVYGYLYDNYDFHLRKSVLCFHGGLEKLFQSCEGSACGYQLEGQRVIPIRQQYEYKDRKDVIHSILIWQKAALAFIQYMVSEGDMVKDIATDERAWAYPLIKFGKRPSNRDIKLFSSFYIEDGKREYFISQKKIYQYTPVEFLHALSGSTWKTGFMKSVFHLPLPYYSIYSLLRK